MAIPKNFLDRFFGQYNDGQNAGAPDWPASRAFAVSPSDGVDLALVTRALWVGGAGTVVVNMADTGSTISFVGVPAGTLLPIRVKRVLATNTTATNIVALD